LKRYLYAADYHYKYPLTEPVVGIHPGASNPITLPLLSTETLDIVSAGSQYTRIEKTIRVAEIEESYRFLDVCVDENPLKINCSACDKCMRTMLTLEIAGKLERYSMVFDLDTYRKNRDFFIEEVLQSNDSYLLKEIADFIVMSGFIVPLSSRLFLRTRLDHIKSTVKNTTNLPNEIVQEITRKWLKNI